MGSELMQLTQDAIGQFAHRSMIEGWIGAVFAICFAVATVWGGKVAFGIGGMLAVMKGETLEPEVDKDMER